MNRDEKNEVEVEVEFEDNSMYDEEVVEKAYLIGKMVVVVVYIDD